MKRTAPIVGVSVALLATASGVLLLRRTPRANPVAVEAAPPTSGQGATTGPPRKTGETTGASYDLDADERSRAELATVERWRSEHGDDLAGALERYRELAKRFPDTEVSLYATRAASGLEERIADAERLRAAANPEPEPAPGPPPPSGKEPKDEGAHTAALEARRREAEKAKAAADAARAESELRDLARSGHLDDARAAAASSKALGARQAALSAELGRLAAGRDALRGALADLDGERVESFDEGRLVVKTKKREVALARLAKAPKLKGTDAANAAEFLTFRGAGALAVLLAEAAGPAGEPLLDGARAAAKAEKSREAESALDLALASNDAAKLRAAAERWKQDAAFAARKDAWKEAYQKARQKVLLADPSQLFRAAQTKLLPGGVVSVTYDWKDPRSAQDWVLDAGCPNSALKLDAKRGQAQVEGHVRNPARFTGRVRVRATILPLKGEAPNACVLLHDQGGWDGVLVALGWDGKGQAKLSVPKDAAVGGGKTFAPPLDAVVLPLGAAKPEKWKIAAGATADTAATGSKLRLEVVKDDKTLVVSANGAPVFELAPAPLPGQLGGVGFVPDASTLVLGEVLLEGKLDPEWVQTAALERSRAEADELAK